MVGVSSPDEIARIHENMRLRLWDYHNEPSKQVPAMTRGPECDEVLDHGSGFGLESSDFFEFDTLILDPAIIEYAAAA